MVSYSDKYSDRALAKKPLDKMLPDERGLFDALVDEQAEKIAKRWEDQPQLLHAVSMRLAQHVLEQGQTTPRGDDGRYVRRPVDDDDPRSLLR